MDIINGRYAKCREIFKKNDINELRKEVDWHFEHNLHPHCVIEKTYDTKYKKSPLTTDSIIDEHGLIDKDMASPYPYQKEIWNTFTVTMAQKVRRYLEKTNPDLLKRTWEYKEPCINGHRVYPHAIYAIKWDSSERYRMDRNLSFNECPLHWSTGYRLKNTTDIKYKNDKFINVVYYLDKGMKYLTDSQRQDLNLFDGGTVVEKNKNIFKDESEENSAFIFTDHRWSLAGENITAIIFSFSIFSENRHANWMYPRVADYENRMKRRCKNSVAVSEYIMSETGKIYK
jgi:hypothetical protein